MNDETICNICLKKNLKDKICFIKNIFKSHESSICFMSQWVDWYCNRNNFKINIVEKRLIMKIIINLIDQKCVHVRMLTKNQFESNNKIHRFKYLWTNIIKPTIGGDYTHKVRKQIVNLNIYESHDGVLRAVWNNEEKIYVGDIKKGVAQINIKNFLISPTTNRKQHVITQF